MITKKQAAVEAMRHLATCPGHGYDQNRRWGDGGREDVVLSDVLKIVLATGDRDCSSAIISAFEAAGIPCGGATYTGNMRSLMTATGNFRVRPASFAAKAGDVYLNDRSHTALCTGGGQLAQFSIDERGGISGGRAGDQTGAEAAVRGYYDYPWDCVLECVNREEFAGGRESWAVQMYDPNNTDAQLWSLEDAGGAWSYIRSKATGLYLDVIGAAGKSGTVVWVYRKNRTKAQKWRFEGVEGFYNPSKPFLIVPAVNTRLALDVEGGDERQGARLRVWKKNDTNAQAWTSADKGDSWMSFINVGTMNALDVVGGGRA